jgi:Flp pilus assembly protein TadG
MNSSNNSRHARRLHSEQGQIIVLAVLAMTTLIGGVALVLEAGNAYAQERGVQNGADAAANAGAAVLAQRLGGVTKTDADVLAAVTSSATANNITIGSAAYYTDVTGNPLNAVGVIVTPPAAARVGGGTIPPGAQGVWVGGGRTYGTFFGHVIGISSMGASAEATAVTGRLTGGAFLPVVFPVNITDCDGTGGLGTGEANWQISNPGVPPDGQEYIVPLCKTQSGSFMVLNLDPTLDCQQEVSDPPNIQFAQFPTDVSSDNGNNCSNLIEDDVNALAGHVVLIPICDGDCVTSGGTNATYHIIKVTAFYLDYMSAVNNGVNANCEGNGTTLIPITGNGSSSCLVGWFVRYITSGPVAGGPIGNSDAIGVQLIK